MCGGLRSTASTSCHTFTPPHFTGALQPPPPPHPLHTASHARAVGTPPRHIAAEAKGGRGCNTAALRRRKREECAGAGQNPLRVPSPLQPSGAELRRLCLRRCFRSAVHSTQQLRLPLRPVAPVRPQRGEGERPRWSHPCPSPRLSPGGPDRLGFPSPCAPLRPSTAAGARVRHRAAPVRLLPRARKQRRRAPPCAATGGRRVRDPSVRTNSACQRTTLWFFWPCGSLPPPRSLRRRSLAKWRRPRRPLLPQNMRTAGGLALGRSSSRLKSRSLCSGHWRRRDVMRIPMAYFRRTEAIRC